jgi:hypothetical protein
MAVARVISINASTVLPSGAAKLGLLTYASAPNTAAPRYRRPKAAPTTAVI